MLSNNDLMKINKKYAIADLQIWGCVSARESEDIIGI